MQFFFGNSKVGRTYQSMLRAPMFFLIDRNVVLWYVTKISSVTEVCAFAAYPRTNK